MAEIARVEPEPKGKWVDFEVNRQGFFKINNQAFNVHMLPSRPVEICSETVKAFGGIQYLEPVSGDVSQFSGSPFVCWHEKEFLTCLSDFMEIDSCRYTLPHKIKFWGRNKMNKLIGLCGYAQVGKDTLGKLMIEREGYKRYAFADRLKKEVRSMLRELVIRVDFNNPKDKEQWRDFLVFWGAKRRQMDKDYWVEVLDIHIDFSKRAVITDVRYLNEVEWIKNKGGEVYRIKREGYGPANEEELSFKLIEANTNLPIIQNVEEHPEMMLYQLKKE